MIVTSARTPVLEQDSPYREALAFHWISFTFSDCVIEAELDEVYGILLSLAACL